MTSDDGPIIGDVVSVTRDVVQATSVGGLVAKDIVLATGASISITRDATFGGSFWWSSGRNCHSDNQC